jgi:hypothetical protein
VFSFRPQETGQSNLTPQAATSLYISTLLPLKAAFPWLRFGSPAPSSNPNGKQWLLQFLGNCTAADVGSCGVDFIAFRACGNNFLLYDIDANLDVADWYDVNATDFQIYVVIVCPFPISLLISSRRRSIGGLP